MSVKPPSASSVIPPGRDQGKRPPDGNRFAPLARLSVSGNGPPKSPAVKRPNEGNSSQANKTMRTDEPVVVTNTATGSGMQNGRILYVMEGVEKMMAKGRDDLDKVRKALLDCKDLTPALREVLGGMISSMDNMTNAFETLASVVVDNAAVTPPPKQGQVRGGGAATPTPEQTRKKKFVQAVTDAEKAILVFNLDMGKVPIMNTNTLARHVTQDITSKAAVAEGKQNGRPAEETIIALDDALSMVSGMDFFGKVTKPFQNKFNKDDPLNGTYCTMPVKMNFKSKEARTRAETMLKKKCKVSCTVPYPTRLRQMIKETIQAEKVAHPNCFIQVRVDTESLSLKVSRKEGDKWINNYEVKAIEDKVMDIGTVRNDIPVPMETGSSQASL
jgi:hypothetical protein